MTESCKKLLKTVYEHNQYKSDPLQIDATGQSLGYNTSRELKHDIDFLVDSGYLKKQIPILRAYLLTITSEGERFVENNFNLSSEAQNFPTNIVFNVQNATNSIIGTQANVTMNIGDVIQQARKEIDSSNSDDKEELHKIINLLEDNVENKSTIKKGALSKFASVIQRNSWITGSIASIILKWLTGI